MDNRARQPSWATICLTIIVLLALVGFSLGINWGLPQARSPETVEPWAIDTIAPIAPLNEAYHRFTRAGTENVIYPLFHYVVLSGAFAPYLAWEYLAGNFSDPSSTFPYGVADIERFAQNLTIIARLVSVMMGLGIVLAAYRIADLLADREVAIWTGLVSSLIAPLCYYAKISNLDVPYTFWVMLAVWATVHIILYQRHWAYVLLGAFAALAVATKDQAYGFFVLLPFALAYARAKAQSEASVSFLSFGKSLFCVPMLYGAAAALLTYALANNVFLGGFDGLMRHFAWGGDVYQYRTDTSDTFYGLQSQLQTAGRTSKLLLQMLGPVTCALVAYGLYLAWQARNWTLMILVLLSASYYVSVIAVFNIVFSRYLLATAVLLAPFAGIALQHLRVKHGNAVMGILAVLALVPQVLFVVNLNMTLIRDSRYAVSDWLTANAPAGSVVESQVRQGMLPHLPENLDYSIVGNTGDPITMLVEKSALTAGELAARDPDFILVLEGLGVTGDVLGWDDPDLINYYEGLISGEFGYREVARFETPHILPWHHIPGTRPTSVILARTN